MSYQEDEKLKQMRLTIKILGLLMALILILASIFLKQISGLIGNNITSSIFPVVKYVLLAAGVFDIIFFAFVVK